MLTVFSIVNKPVPSNCYVLYDKAIGDECAVIDPGSKSDEELLTFIGKEGLKPQYIVLTHEHFDHCWGVNELVERYHIPIVCSRLCAECIRFEKRNCSLFYDYDERFSIQSDTIAVEDIGYQLPFLGTSIKFINTYGHTKASICFFVDHNLFSGDTLIRGCKTVTKLPTGSEDDLAKTMQFFRTQIVDYVVWPGHGERFLLHEIF